MRRIVIDLTGQRFGSLVVIRKTEKRKRKEVLWECLCDCGRTKLVATAGLRKRNVVSCGCRFNPRKRDSSGVILPPGFLRCLKCNTVQPDGNFYDISNASACKDCLNKKAVEARIKCKDKYIRKLIREQYQTGDAAISGEFIALKKEQVQLTRNLKKIKNKMEESNGTS